MHAHVLRESDSEPEPGPGVHHGIGARPHVLQEKGSLHARQLVSHLSLVLVVEEHLLCYFVQLQQTCLTVLESRAVYDPVRGVERARVQDRGQQQLRHASRREGLAELLLQDDRVEDMVVREVRVNKRHLDLDRQLLFADGAARRAHHAWRRRVLRVHGHGDVQPAVVLVVRAPRRRRPVLAIAAAAAVRAGHALARLPLDHEGQRPRLAQVGDAAALQRARVVVGDDLAPLVGLGGGRLAALDRRGRRALSRKVRLQAVAISSDHHGRVGRGLGGGRVGNARQRHGRGRRRDYD